MKNIELTDFEVSVLKKCAVIGFDEESLSIPEHDAFISLLEKADDYESQDDALLDERMDYYYNSDLLIWFYYRWRLQNGECEPWDGKTIRPRAKVIKMSEA